MTYFVCTEVIDNVCSSWIEQQSLLLIDLDDGLYLGGMFFLLSISAWGFKFIFNVISNRR